MTRIKTTAAMLILLGAAALAQNLGFHFYGPVSRYVTPSTPTSGHAAVFCFDNPALSGVTGQVYNLVGRQVATFISAAPGNPVVGLKPACTQVGALPGISMHFAVWDGTADGTFVHSGLYVYRVQAEGGTYTGTLVVVK